MPPRSDLSFLRLAAPAALVLGLAACSDEGAAPIKAAATEALPVRLATVGAAQDSAELHATGTVRLKRETALGFNTNGRLAQVLVLEGQGVRPGQLLARLDPTGVDAASEAARAEAVRAEADLKRLRKLAAEGWITKPRLEAAEAAASAARARVEQTGFDARFASIVAPTGAVVLRRQAEPGQMLSAGQPVVTIGELSSGYVLRIPMSDADLVRLRLGQTALVTIPALGAAPVAATVSEIGARGDDRTGTFQVELRLPKMPGLRSGLIGDAAIRAGAAPGSAPATALAVPATAVFAARADEGFVYVYDPAAGVVRARMVALGPIDDRGIVITRGLKPGERVVTSGPDRLRDGAPVKVAA